jgi:hypothetical protein
MSSSLLQSFFSWDFQRSRNRHELNTIILENTGTVTKFVGAMATWRPVLVRSWVCPSVCAKWQLPGEISTKDIIFNIVPPPL